MLSIYNFLKVKLCYRTYWKQWLALLAICLLVFACSGGDEDSDSPCPNQPQLTTLEVSNISIDENTDLASATFSGEIQNIQLGANCETFSITNQGFVYGTNIQPTTSDNVVNANGENIYVNLNNLFPETTYYVRTYITNALGTFYGNEVSFTTPESEFVPISDEEVITTMIVTLLANDAGPDITMQIQDLDGDGPNDPVVTVSGPLSSATSYSGSIEWLNELEDPPEDFTMEILDEQDEHQVFFEIGDGLPIQVIYADEDSMGNPVGVNFILAPTQAGVTGSGSLTITLVYEPDKPNDGTVDSAGGSIEMQASFAVVVE